MFHILLICLTNLLAVLVYFLVFLTVIRYIKLIKSDSLVKFLKSRFAFIDSYAHIKKRVRQKLKEKQIFTSNIWKVNYNIKKFKY